MKTYIIDSEELTKDAILKEIDIKLSKEEINEYLDILNAINKGMKVYNITTNKGQYLFYLDTDDKIKDVVKIIN